MSTLNDEIKECALRLLTRREHSRLELKQKLLGRAFNSEDIELVLANLVEFGLQSDARFCENYIRYRADSGFGPYRIAQELRVRGVSSEVADQYLDSSDPKWQEVAEQVVKKKFGENPPHDFTTRAKINKFLQYRGFSSKDW